MQTGPVTRRVKNGRLSLISLRAFLPDYCLVLTHLSDYCSVLTHLSDYCSVLTHLSDYCSVLTHLSDRLSSGFTDCFSQERERSVETYSKSRYRFNVPYTIHHDCFHPCTMFICPGVRIFSIRQQQLTNIEGIYSADCSQQM